jgi:hypothetical protein
MKLAASLVLLLCFSVAFCNGQDNPIKLDKDTVDKAKDILDKVIGEAKGAVGKTKDGSKELWARTKETLGLTREDYVKRAASGLKTMDAEIQVLAESGSAVNSREYFKTRIEGLKQHLDYCKRDFERLQAAESEEAFRVKQKGFDRGLGFLGDNIELAQEEAGL